jgi:hypothetical protein
MIEEVARVAALARLGLPADQPSDLTFEDAAAWVIWQFPLPHEGWLCGAAHPPVTAFGWLPIMIDPAALTIRVHPSAIFVTPEAAARWIAAR